MTDLSSIRLKIADLKTQIASNSISPTYLGSLLDEILSAIDSIDKDYLPKADPSLTAKLQTLSSAIDVLENAAKAINAQGVVSGEEKQPEVYGNVIYLPMVVRFPGGGSTVRRLTLPAATEQTAGLYDTATRKAVATAIETARGEAANAQAAADDARAAADEARNVAEAAMDNGNDAITFAENGHRDILGKIGVAGGIAPLNASGLIDARFLPSFVDDIVEFAGKVGNVEIQSLAPPMADLDGSERVVYCTYQARFLLSLKGRYYKSWSGYETYGDTATTGVRPVAGKIYVDTVNDTLSRWSGSGLRELPAVVVLGTSAGMAFPGDQGVALQRAVNALQAETAAHALTAQVLTGTLPAVTVNDMIENVKQRVLEINLPAGATYELTVSEMNVVRLDVRVLKPDGNWQYVLYKVPQGKPQRFTLATSGTRIAFSAWDDMNAAVNYADDFQVVMSFTLRRVEGWELAAAT